MADIHDTDDGFHEIHLSGKQLVFLFMATTVVSVVIFLCGVFVGRGVQAQAHQPMEQAFEPSPIASAPAPPVPLSDSGPQAMEPPAPPTEAVELSYKQRLEGDAPRETLDVTPPAPRADSTSAPAASRWTARTERAPEPPARSAARTTGSEVASPTRSAAASPVPASATADQSGSWVVQVHALRDRNTANAIVQRLAAKGYPAFLTSGGPSGIYRVQVGRFKDRQEAERTRERLKKEEKYDPWITH